MCECSSTSPIDDCFFSLSLNAPGTRISGRTEARVALWIGIALRSWLYFTLTSEYVNMVKTYLYVSTFPLPQNPHSTAHDLCTTEALFSSYLRAPSLSGLPRQKYWRLSIPSYKLGHLGLADNLHEHLLVTFSPHILLFYGLPSFPLRDALHSKLLNKLCLKNTCYYLFIGEPTKPQFSLPWSPLTV